jgi:hypothetical protein
VKRIILIASLFGLLAAIVGCTRHDPASNLPPVQKRDAKYVLSVVIDVSGSFEDLLEEKAWPFLQRILRDFYRNRAGEDDVLIIGQISAVPVAPIFEGSPKSFARQYGNARAFQELLKTKANPSGSRVHDSVADVAEYALRYSTDQNQTFLCVLSDFDENFPKPNESEERLVKVLSKFARPNMAVGLYWLGLRFAAKWESNLRRAGVQNFIVASEIVADPKLPIFE